MQTTHRPAANRQATLRASSLKSSFILLKRSLKTRWSRCQAWEIIPGCIPEFQFVRRRTIMTSKRMALNPGMRIGSYEVLGLLGKGGMGEVYRGRDTNLKREVAIKVLPEAFAQDQERVPRLQREAQILASLNDAH